MAHTYAARLKKGINYGKCGLPENYDTDRMLLDKTKRLNKLIKECKYMVAFTGAGISTSVGIPDFRGPDGVWTKEKQGRLNQHANSEDDFRFEDAIPSVTHMALLALMQAGKLKYICSQNVDGLHIRSGIPQDKLGELHGNVFAEECEKCNLKYYRTFDVQSIGFKPTGRFCDCGEELKDTLLDWDDALPDEDYERSQEEASRADLVLCLGTSLRVQPASEIPKLCMKKNRGGKIVICNLQATPLDSKAAIKINERCDVVMRKMLDNLHLKIPIYHHKEIILIEWKPSASDSSSRCLRIRLESKLKLKKAIQRISIQKDGETIVSKESQDQDAIEIDEGELVQNQSDVISIHMELIEGCQPTSLSADLDPSQDLRFEIVTKVLDYNDHISVSNGDYAASDSEDSGKDEESESDVESDQEWSEKKTKSKKKQRR
eukprot:TRINITY_DN8709_c0_g1_i2.p1 TRINITY_DN8709_c0_g1~~TRINITY_DN8709_c0_g1_i2.p1  ORF type:complete len:433 (-),score=88.16 TRINITY_DN8709_c0_g1_i2:20-1318(-)